MSSAAILTAPTDPRCATGKSTAPDPTDVAALDSAIASGDWSAFDRVIVAFSGGKDSLACVLRLLDLGCERERLELWHHDVDGREGSTLMDWPVTRSYCQAVATHFGIPLLYSWKVGGFEGEMLRDDCPTQATTFELLDGTTKTVGGKGPHGSRLKFPQVAADLKVRWCSAYLKIDVASKVFAGDPRFNRGGRFLMITGERREESAARSRYAEIERDRAATKSRNILRWRPVIDYTEAEVWEVIERYGIEPHPAYVLGFGRVSCAACIFGNPNQWAAVRDLFPERFEAIASYEERFGLTINRERSVHEQADRGTSLVRERTEAQKATGQSRTFTLPIVSEDWTLPAGAFAECGGPS